MPDTVSYKRLPQVKQATGLSRSTILRKAAEGTFPRPIKISERAIAWNSDQLKAWLANPQGWRGEGEA